MNASATDPSPSQPPAASLPVRVPLDRFFAALKDLLSASGPFVSFYLPVRDDADRAQSFQAVMSAEGLSVGEQAFGRSLLAVERAADDAMIVGFVAADGASLMMSFPEGSDVAFVETAALPRLAPVIEAEQRLRHHILAVVSDDGIDLLTFPRHGRATLHRAEPGDHDYATLLISEAARQTETPLVLIASEDDTAAELARRVALEVPIETRVQALSASGGPSVLAERAVREVADDRALAAVDSIRGWKFERSHGLAASGVQATLTSLRTDEIRMVLVHQDSIDQRQAWFGSAPDMVALDLEDASAHLDPSAMTPGHLVDVVLRSAILRDIPVTIVPDLPTETLPGGLGVIRSVLAGS